MKDCPIYRQRDTMDCGPTYLQMIAKFYGRYYRLESLRELCAISRTGVSMLGISEAADSLSFHTLGAKIRFEDLISEKPVPCIAHWNKNHFVVVYGVKKTQDTIVLHIADPHLGKCTYTKDEFCRYWCSSTEDNVPHGIILALEPTPRFYERKEDDLTPKRSSLLYKLPPTLSS